MTRSSKPDYSTCRLSYLSNLCDPVFALPLNIRQSTDSLHLVQVEVFDVLEGGTAATSGLLRKGDRVIAAQGSVGDMMWPKTTIQGLQTAVRTRMSGNSIRLRFERTVNLGTWEEQSRKNRHLHMLPSQHP